MLAVFWCTTSYTVLILLWKMLVEPVNAHAGWWPCACLKCVSGLRKLEKTFNFLRCIHVFDLVLKFGSDMNEGNCLHLLFYSIVLMGIVALVVGMKFFLAVFHILDWSFLVLHFDGNVCDWIPKVIWQRMDWFWVFFVGKRLLSLTSYLYWLKSGRIAQLLTVFDDINFFRCFVWGVFWSVF